MCEKISIIVPIYNSEGFLKDCIYSILNQSYKNIEIILVNDCSFDNSKKICENFASKYDCIKFINLEKNGGVSHARNVGLKSATGDYIGFVDSDDVINCKMYEVLLNNLKNTDSDISICNYDKKLVCNHSYNDEICINYLSEELMYEVLKEGSIMGFSCNKLYKKEFLTDLYFDETITIYEDILFNLNYFKRIKKGCYTKNKLYYYIQRENGAIRGKFNISKLSVYTSLQHIEKIYDEYNLDKDFFYLKYLIACLDIKEKLVYERKSFNDIFIKNEKKIKECLIKVNKSKKIDFNLKVKLNFKNYLTKTFIKIKELKK